MEELIFRSLRGDASDLDERQLRRWRLSSAENEAYYQEIVRLWSLDAGDRPEGSPPPPPGLESILKTAESRRTSALPLTRRVARGHSQWVAGAVAIAAMLVALFGISLLRSVPDHSPGLNVANFATGEEETVMVTLNDGSFVRLAPSSRLRFGDREDEREVWLEGRAFFAVAHDSVRPFSVRTQAGEALVLGTRFEIHVQDDDMRLAVSEGEVSLSTDEDRVGVRAGEVAHLTGRSPPSVVQVDDVFEFIEWPQGLLIFQATPLDQVARELAYHFGVSLVIPDPAVGRRTVTGWFVDEEFEEVLTAVCRATQTRCSIEADSVRVRPKLP